LRTGPVFTVAVAQMDRPQTYGVFAMAFRVPAADSDSQRSCDEQACPNDVTHAIKRRSPVR
jgi:hypothetical protein